MATIKKASVSKAKKGGSFDLNKDGKTTFKDVLIGRGVLPKTAKKGMTVKKAQTGKTLSPAPKKKGAMDAVKDLGKYVSTFGLATEKYNPAPSKAAKKTPKNKMGGMTSKKAMYGSTTMKSGGKMGKCKYGCK